MDWKSCVQAALSADVPDEDVIEELAQHAAAMYQAARADGLSHEAAYRRVRDQLERWRLEAPALRHRSHRAAAVEPPIASSSRMTGIGQDVRYAARLLRRQPRYTLLSTVTMALGIGATTVLFSLTYGVLLEPLPWPDADRIVVLEETRGGRAPRFGAFSNAAYVTWRDQATTIEEIAAWSQRNVTLTGAGDSDRIRITAATASLFRVIGARPLVGSLFDERDEQSLNPSAIVVSESLWRQRFGADRAALGRLVRIDGVAHRIVGVLPDAMAYPDRQARAWVPLRVMPVSGNALSMFDAIAKLRPGVTAQQAASEGTARGRFAPDTGMTTTAIFGGQGRLQITAVPWREKATAEVRRPLIVLLAAVCLLLATATANVAGLQLARATTRGRELAIRAALGAGQGRVTRQLLIESLLLGLIGGGAGLLVAAGLHRVLPSVLPADFPRVDDLRITVMVVLFGLAVSVVTGVIFGVLPAWRARRLNLVQSLAEDGAAPVGGGGRSRTVRARMLIMAGQVAIACVLLVGASLLARSFVALMEADRGYEPAGVSTARVSLPSTMYTPQQSYAMVRQILDRLAASPMVAHAAFTSELPLNPGGSTSAFTMRSRQADGGTIWVQAAPRVVAPRYFAALGMRIVEGRGFADSDTEAAPPVVVVNRAFARRYLDDSPLDERLPMGLGYGDTQVDAAVVGVVDDVRYPTAGDTSQPEMYYSYRQLGGRLTVPVVTLIVRTSGDPAALAPVLRTVIRDADRGLVPDAVMTLEDRMMRSLARPRLYAVLLGTFAALAVAVAAVGLFGVLSYSVAQRSRELAVRSALGARRLDIVTLVLRQGLAVTIAGLVAGLLGSLALTRSIETLLYGVTTHDAVTYVVVPALLLLVAAVACLFPARDAARVDPWRALRT